MEFATALERKRSPLAHARLQRQLPVREAAAKAGLTEDEVSWLEEGRVYRFRTADDALLALMLYATALEIDHHEAREIAGLPVGPRPFSANPRARLAVLAGLAAAAVALAAVFVLPGSADERAREAQASRLAAEAALPKPWQIDVDVLTAAATSSSHAGSPRGSARSATTSPAFVAQTASTIRRRPFTTSAAATTSRHGSRAS